MAARGWGEAGSTVLRFGASDREPSLAVVLPDGAWWLKCLGSRMRFTLSTQWTAVTNGILLLLLLGINIYSLYTREVIVPGPRPESVAASMGSARLEHTAMVGASYLSITEFNSWKTLESRKRDRQYVLLKEAIDRLKRR